MKFCQKEKLSLAWAAKLSLVQQNKFLKTDT